MKKESLSAQDYKDLFRFSRELAALEDEDNDGILRLLDVIFGLRLTLYFVLDAGGGLSTPRVSYITSLSMSREYLEGCVAAYSGENTIYESMRRRRTANSWRGIAYTEDSPEGEYNGSGFMCLLARLGFTYVAVMYMSLDPIICVGVSKPESEGGFNCHERALLQEIYSALSALTAARLRRGAKKERLEKKPSPDAEARYDLTKQEFRIAGYLYAGLSNAEIAKELSISQNTVKVHIYNMFQKLGVKNRLEAIRALGG